MIVVKTNIIDTLPFFDLGYTDPETARNMGADDAKVNLMLSR